MNQMLYIIIRRKLTFVRKMSKYVAPASHGIIKTTTLYSDGKTQVPKEVIEQLKLNRGSIIVWMKDGDRIYVKNATE